MAEIKWKGGWSSTFGVSDMTYYRNDVVSYDNITYIVTAVSVAIGSPNPTQDMGNWDTFVSGAEGTSGISGINGTSGTSGISPIGDLRLFTAGTAGTSWTFTHNLGTPRPIVQVWGTSGQVIVPAEITSLSNTQIRIDFPEAVAGTATIGNGYSGTSGTSGTSGISPIGTARIFTAGTAGTSWTFAHNLATPRPIVQVWNTSGAVIIPSQIRSINDNTVTLEFPVAVAGTATIGNGFSGTSGTTGTSGSSGTSGIGVPTGGTSGQFLVKNSSTSGDMSWTTRRPQYISARKNAVQTGAALNTDVTFQAVNASNELVLTSSTTVALTGGKVYLVNASFGADTWANSTNGFFNIYLVDAANNPISQNYSVMVPTTNTSGASTNNSMTLIYAPTTNISVKFRCVSTNTTVTLREDMCHFTITEIL